jgi:microbial collagenase
MRHEFSHYLVGRFLIGGLWGLAPIYADERLTWCDEGLAEFLTWSTSRNGVKVRKRLVQLVAADGQNGRMTVSQILSATYGNFTFYRYAALLFAYWYLHDLATLKTVLALVRAGDVPGFDALVAQLKADAGLETAYQAFLDGVVADVANLDDPQTSFPPPNALDESNPAQVQLLVRATRLGYLANASVAAVSVNTRFSCRGYLSGQLVNQADPIAAWKEFDAGLNEIIGQLQPGPPNNFQGLVGRFGRIRFVDYNGQIYPQADYFLDGPLGPGQNALLAPAAQVTADFHATRLGTNAVCTLINPGLVECTVTLTTRTYDNAVPDATLTAELADDLEELRNQVYAIRPPYYRTFECSFSGPAQVLPYTQAQKYMLRPVLCQVHLA